jgi:hypothetical protein
MAEGKVFINDVEFPTGILRLMCDMADQAGWVRFAALPERGPIKVSEPEPGYLLIDGERIAVDDLFADADRLSGRETYRKEDGECMPEVLSDFVGYDVEVELSNGTRHMGRLEPPVLDYYTVAYPDGGRVEFHKKDCTELTG